MFKKDRLVYVVHFGSVQVKLLFWIQQHDFKSTSKVKGLKGRNQSSLEFTTPVDESEESKIPFKNTKLKHDTCIRISLLSHSLKGPLKICSGRPV